jgi:hypothetical protein
MNIQNLDAFAFRKVQEERRIGNAIPYISRIPSFPCPEYTGDQQGFQELFKEFFHFGPEILRYPFLLLPEMKKFSKIALLRKWEEILVPARIRNEHGKTD